MVAVKVTTRNACEVPVSIHDSSAVNVQPGVGYHIGDFYEGAYEFTPSQDTQVISISGKTATQDITINPIPSNYGLITQIGNIILVS